ncbi:D-amino-acid transaminase [Ferrovibrio sp. MS7]|uniref:D-amino-acid transaminase n=1 Tax=Ferrovibrio plantarum TaxID=3119164 RepID=UPI003135AAB8
MSRVAYVNGRYQPYRNAMVHVEDRGFQFADGVYEVIAVIGGRMVDAEGHIVRLERNLDELRIAHPMSRAALQVVFEETIRRNRVDFGSIYVQVTRGAARRDFPFPAGARPTLVAIAKPLDRAKIAANAAKGVAAITTRDQRWARCDIKSVGLLPAALAKQQAKEAGAFEAWLVDGEGRVTEGSSSNAWIVTKDGALVTRQLDNGILSGITRSAILALAKAEGLKIEQRAFTPAEAYEAREAFVTSTTAFLMPVTSLDGRPIGNGAPGLLSGKIRALYEVYADSQAAGELPSAPYLAP